MGDSGFDVSGLNLLSEVADLAGFDSNTRAWDVAIQMLMEFKIMKKKGFLAAHLEKTFFIPKKKRSNLSISISERTDLLAFCIPKKKRSNLVSHTMKRKRSGEQDGQIPRLKRRRTITGDDLGSPLSSVPLAIPTHSEELKNKISSHIPLWSFQRKSPLRFSLIKLHLSAARTTAVS